MRYLTISETSQYSDLFMHTVMPKGDHWLSQRYSGLHLNTYSTSLSMPLRKADNADDTDLLLKEIKDMKFT